MPSYATIDDVKARLRHNFEAIYSPRGYSAADEAIVLADIEAAEADLHSYLATRYLVPVADAEAVKLLRHWTLTLVEELAYGAVPGRKMDEGVAGRATALRARLADIAAGKLSLGTAAELPASPDRDDIDAAFIGDGPAPEFKRSQMEGF